MGGGGRRRGRAKEVGPGASVARRGCKCANMSDGGEEKVRRKVGKGGGIRGRPRARGAAGVRAEPRRRVNTPLAPPPSPSERNNKRVGQAHPRSSRCFRSLAAAIWPACERETKGRAAKARIREKRLAHARGCGAAKSRLARVLACSPAACCIEAAMAWALLPKARVTSKRE